MLLFDPVDAEPIWEGLLQHLKTKLAFGTPDCVFETISRQYTAPPNLAAELQPALFLVQMGEAYKPVGTIIGGPTKLTLRGYLVIFAKVPGPGDQPIGQETDTGGTILNALLKPVRGAFAPDVMFTGKLTLGGLVEHCWLEGDAPMDPGILSSQGAVLLPVCMLVP